MIKKVWLATLSVRVWLLKIDTNFPNNLLGKAFLLVINALLTNNKQITLIDDIITILECVLNLLKQCEPFTRFIL